ncbi:MAG: hypothetical protein M3141_02980 [Actinomycetota bacterium]|nr:hypothetical protein [Actinomycetota bacterium]
MPESEDFERRPAPTEGGGSDARAAAREHSDADAEREGEPREGEERRATGNPGAAGDES